jgi:glycine/D-amino acid oxidase-like deaminating enzyme
VSTVHVWTLPLLRSLGLTFPIKHFVHQRYLSKPLTVDPGLLSFPPVNADPYGGYVRPAAGGRILLGIETPDREEWRVTGTSFRMSEMQAPEGLLEGAVRWFLPFVPMLAEVSWESTEVGLISFSMDGEPLLGPVDEVPGLYLGTAFHSGGFSYNTVAGLALAEWVVDGRPFMDFSAFRPSRFARQDTDAHLAMTLVQRQAVRRRH